MRQTSQHIQSGASYFHYYIRDHQGNNRVVANYQGTIEQTTHYYPYGGILSQSTNQGVQKYKYNGKELDRMHGLDMYDFGARQQDPEVGMFTSMDPLCEKYYNISPYAYCAGNPVRYVDMHGDSISVTEEYQETFMNSMKDVFGNFIDNLSFSENNMLTYIGNNKDIKKLGKDAKKLFKGMQMIMNSSDVIDVIFDNHSNMVSAEMLSKHCGGLTIFKNESLIQILIDPNGVTEFTTQICLQSFFDHEGVPNGKDVMFDKRTYKTNVTDKLFHEFGEILYHKGNYERIIDYNNHARKKIGLDSRKYDENHNRYTPK